MHESMSFFYGKVYFINSNNVYIIRWEFNKEIRRCIRPNTRVVVFFLPQKRPLYLIDNNVTSFTMRCTIEGGGSSNQTLLA